MAPYCNAERDDILGDGSLIGRQIVAMWLR